MLVYPTPLFRKRRGTARRTPAAPPTPAALTLVEAIYDDTIPLIRLGFDRAIDISALDGTQIIVNDVPENLGMLATGPASLVDATTVEILLVLDGIASGAGWNMTATAATGIVAVDDGGTWVGATDLALPYP